MPWAAKGLLYRIPTHKDVCNTVRKYLQNIAQAKSVESIHNYAPEMTKPLGVVRDVSLIRILKQ